VLGLGAGAAATRVVDVLGVGDVRTGAGGGRGADVVASGATERRVMGGFGLGTAWVEGRAVEGRAVEGRVDEGCVDEGCVDVRIDGGGLAVVAPLDEVAEDAATRPRVPAELAQADRTAANRIKAANDVKPRRSMP
jgi:hypothetical protein